MSVTIRMPSGGSRAIVSKAEPKSSGSRTPSAWTAMPISTAAADAAL